MSPSASTSKQVCGVCEKEAKSRCGGCKRIPFCSAECQELIWSTHKALSPNDAAVRAAFNTYAGGSQVLWPRVQRGDARRNLDDPCTSRDERQLDMGSARAPPPARSRSPRRGLRGVDRRTP
ncbi:RHTO0S02e14928g2_1 [Rhodotorula toruloides]|uniref:RHTO0S02e14928g2_1 n=1 Tax=Rhodotorula toruloides TaxID=5286 RepID=A0A061AIR8_RHOTO|nr:RHTO0S02e14928g2_1 [Rhodotorula toruloides]